MTLRLAHIFRHPIKAHGREDLASVLLSAGECIPGDRHWAVAHEAAKLVAGWNPCSNFHRGAKAPGLMAITARMTAESVTLWHPDLPEFTLRPDDPADFPGFLAWLAPLCPAGRAQPAQIVRAGRGMTDTEFPSISILSLASLRELSRAVGQELSPHRFRGNLWLDGADPFQEFDWIGRDLRIGDAVLTVKARITRCRATMANPETGHIDADTLGALTAAYGHRDFGVYAEVTQSGPIACQDKVVVL